MKFSQKWRMKRSRMSNPGDAAEEQTLRAKLLSGEWVIRNMLPDGNCLFRAVAEQVYGDTSMCDRVREQTMDHEENARHVFSQFVDEPFDDYLNRMRRNGQCADNPELQAIAELFCRPIKVYAAESGKLTTFKCGTDEESVGKSLNPPILLMYINGDHYNSIIDTKRPSVGVGLGLPGLEAPETGIETQVIDKVTNDSEMAETEKRMLDSALAETEREQDEEALMTAALQQTQQEEEERLLKAAMDASVVPNADNEEDDLQKAIRASEEEMMQRALLESMSGAAGRGGGNNF